MTEQFIGKTFGTMGGSWTINENGIVFKGKDYPYESIEIFNLVTTPTTGLTNGVISFKEKTNEKTYSPTFKKSEQAVAHEAIYYVNCKIEECNGIENAIDHLYAHTGTLLRIYEDYLTINHMQVGSVLQNIARGGALGAKRINYDQLTAIQFRKPAGLTVGFIQFAYPGAIESKKGITEMLNDENSVPVTPALVNDAERIVSYIEKRREEIKQNSVTRGPMINQTSAADEILKYKQLLDMGVLSQEEFDAKKKELLGF